MTNERSHPVAGERDRVSALDLACDEIKQLNAKLKRAVDAMQSIMDNPAYHPEVRSIARAVLDDIFEHKL